jgi:monoamine oxidase
MDGFYDIIVVGAGAAGISAGRRLAKAGVSFVLLEARDRVGGRAHTIVREQTVDMGCGWLHSADRNVMVGIAEASGFTVERSPAPWTRQSGHVGVTDAELEDFRNIFKAFEDRIDAEAEKNPPVAASAYLEPGNRWNAMLHAIFSYISGGTLECIDARDYARYEDTEKNWRVREGYGAVFAALGADLPVMLDTHVRAIDSGGGRVRVETSRGAVEGRAAIVTVPTSMLQTIAFTPAIADKLEAADGLPLGTAEKVYFLLAQPDELPVDGHLFPRFDATDIGSYHLRPMSKPLVEVYFGGDLALGLAQAGPEAMAAYAKDELGSLLGSSFPSRLTTMAASAWAVDPLAMGSYSYAKPGCAEMRAVLAEPRESLFFAGEACSRHRYSTAHGAFETGFVAAEQTLAFLQRSMPTG